MTTSSTCTICRFGIDDGSTLLTCHRYPQKIVVSRQHFCGEFSAPLATPANRAEPEKRRGLRPVSATKDSD
jgi:hypothetical protein